METPARYHLAPNVILLQPPQRTAMVDGQPEAEYRVNRPASMTSRKQASRKGSRRSKPKLAATWPPVSTAGARPWARPTPCASGKSLGMCCPTIWLQRWENSNAPAAPASTSSAT